jgi:hypothetical protein
VPTLTIVTERFTNLARAVMESLERPDLRWLVIPHPFGGLPEADVRSRAVAVAEQISETLKATKMPVEQVARIEGTLTAPPLLDLTFSEDDGPSRSLEDLELTDGLPVIVPTPDRVQRMLEFALLDPDLEVGPIPPSWNKISVRSAAANAVMAGARPPAFPIILAAIEAMLDVPAFNLHGIQTTTHPIGPAIFFSGPIAAELGIQGGTGCLGPGFPANATIGRAIRLILMNAGGARPGRLDTATHGQPGKWTLCFAENEDESPWPPYRVDTGFALADTTFTAFGAEAPHNINDHGSTTADGVLRTIAGTIATTGNNNMYWLGDTLLVLGPEHAATLARDGLTKQDVQRELHRRARIPVSVMSPGQFQHINSWIASDERLVDQDDKVALVRSPEDIHIVVAGGPGKHSVWFPGWFRSVTRLVVDANGKPAPAIAALRRPSFDART